MDNNDNDVTWNNKWSNRYNTDETWASTSRESYNHMRRPATNHFGNKTIRASSANADSNFFNPEQSSGAALNRIPVIRNLVVFFTSKKHVLISIYIFNKKMKNFER